ncbi:MAG TPA: hypothetical protein VKK31_28860 [Thermoanaerobaculia bacterium]|nr:hypothetical protein [Thermoanaerobaculia bacterium]
MKRTPIVLFLLLAIALGLSAGPHPCHAAEGPVPAMAPAMEEHASCHAQPPAAKAPAQEKDHDCCDPVKGGHILCDQACQGSAVLGFASAVPAFRSFQELSAPVLSRPVSLFVLSIDHVPLA